MPRIPRFRRADRAVAVEIISPNDEAEAVETKRNECFRAGVRLVCVIDLPTRNVWAYQLDGTANLYRTTEM